MLKANCFSMVIQIRLKVFVKIQEHKNIDFSINKIDLLHI